MKTTDEKWPKTKQIGVTWVADCPHCGATHVVEHGFNGNPEQFGLTIERLATM